MRFIFIFVIVTAHLVRRNVPHFDDGVNKEALKGNYRASCQFDDKTESPAFKSPQ
jgi:hypothetical protein